MEYAIIVFKDYCRYKYNACYSSLISIQAPANVINILSLPLLLFTKNRTINLILELVQYNVFVFVPSFAMFIALNAALMPIAYLLMFAKIYHYIMYSEPTARTAHSSIQHKLLQLLANELIWIFIGPLMLLWTFISNDIILFVCSAYTHSDTKLQFTPNLFYDIRILLSAAYAETYQQMVDKLCASYALAHNLSSTTTNHKCNNLCTSYTQEQE